MMSLGKYTFVMRLWLLTRLLLDSASAWAKSYQGTSAQYVTTGYGIPSDGIFPR